MQSTDGAERALLLGLPAWVWASIGLLLGLVVTALVMLMQQRSLQASADLRMKRTAERSVAGIERQLNASGMLLRAMQSVFLAQPDIDQARFSEIHDILQPQRTVPALVMLGFAQREKSSAQVPRYTYRLVAPLASNRALIGFDIASQPDNLRSLLRALHTNHPVMTAVMPLKQAADNPRDARGGVIVRLPAFIDAAAADAAAVPATRRNREYGALAISLRLKPLVRSALPAEAVQDFRVRVFDVTTATPQAIFDSGSEAYAEAPRYGGDVAFGERRWQVLLEPLQRDDAASPLRVTLGGGLTLSLLLSLLLWSVANTRRRAAQIGQQMSQRYRESEERFRTLNEMMPTIVLLVRAVDGGIDYANQIARERLGATIHHGNLQLLVEDAALCTRILGLRPGEAMHDLDVPMRTLNGDCFWANISASNVMFAGVPRLLLVANDISEQRQLTELLVYQASHDALTELYNRREFERIMARMLGTAPVAGKSSALLYIDLDQFKLINDTSGHIAGDQLLSQLALAMREQLRADDVIARLGGDEFGVLAPGTDAADARVLAENLRVRIESHLFSWEQRTYTISASIGVVMLDRPGLTLRDVFAQADSACYMAKEHGRNRVHFHAEDDGEAIRRRREMEWANRLRWVIEENRLLLDYQELVPLQIQADDAPHIELLLRLRDENGAIVMPGAFLPAAERYGLMPMLDRWVISTAIANFTQLHASSPVLGRCAINLSASSIEDDSVADLVLDLAKRHGVALSSLCFEITETEAVRNLAQAVRFIERLRGAGCSIALDDFGAGMSSFGYLKSLPVDVIKIDGSFIRDIGEDPMSRSIVNVIAEIGHQRGVDVVAEWVSNTDMLAILRRAGVDYAQGFALHRPESVRFQRGARGVRTP